MASTQVDRLPPYQTIPSVIDLVVDFGADRTGGTDAAPMLRAAGRSNTILFIPPGTYRLASTGTAPPSAFDPPAALFQRLTNFQVLAFGATFVVDPAIALSGAFHFDRCTNFDFGGATIIGNRTGLSAGQENCAIAASSCVNFNIHDITIGGNFGGNGAGLLGDWLVDGVFKDIRMTAVGIMCDHAFLKNVVFDHIVGYGADTNGLNGAGQVGGKGLSIVADTPNVSNNFTGVAFTVTDGVIYRDCSATNFETGAAFSSGRNIRIIGGSLSGNPGTSPFEGLGLYIFYTNGGTFGSNLAPVADFSAVGVAISGNGATIPGYGALIDSSQCTGGDTLSNIVFTGCVFNNDNSVGVGSVSATDLFGVGVINCSFVGGSQNPNIDSNVLSLANVLDNLMVSLSVPFIIAAKTPASASAAGSKGTVAWDTGFLYVCTATNTWKRVAIATW